MTDLIYMKRRLVEQFEMQYFIQIKEKEGLFYVRAV